MTPEQQRIAIAEACGWKGISHEHLTGYAPWHPTPYIERVMGDLDSIPLDLLPDYLNDLNACTEFEAMLTDDELWEYSKLLMDYRQAANGFPLASRSEVLKLQKATARQRCIAFLKTLNLWKD